MTEIDELIVENAKMLLAYQAEMKARTNGDHYIPHHFKYSRLSSDPVDRVERNLVRLVKRIDPRKFTDMSGIPKVKKLIANCQINLGNESTTN